MPTYSLEGDTSGLPKTRRSGIRFEMEALTPRESWGAGNSNSTFVCRQLANDCARWIKDMVGEVSVVASGSQGARLRLRRYIPEPLAYGFFSDDNRVQFCSIADQTECGGTSDGVNFSSPGSKWPATDWYKYRAVFENFPYAILDEAPIGSLPSLTDIATAAGPFAGARELYRYVIRSRKTYSREQPIPAASTAGGFKVIDDAVPANRKPIGQVGFRVVGMADVTYKWVRVPVGWPPTIGYVAPNPANPWPPKFNPAAVDPSTKRRTRDTFKGTINNDWWDCAAVDGYCWAPGELLYLGFDDSFRYFDAAGDWVCDVLFTFKAKEGGWNSYLDATGLFKEVSLTGTSAGRRPYETNDFNSLFEYL